MNIKCSNCSEVCDINESYILALMLNSEQFKCSKCELKEVEYNCNKLGINIRNNNGNLRPLNEILKELSIEFNDLEIE